MTDTPEQQPCQHKWHDNPALIFPCPECGLDPDDTEQQVMPDEVWVKDYNPPSAAQRNLGCYDRLIAAGFTKYYHEKHVESLQQQLKNRRISANARNNEYEDRIARLYTENTRLTELVKQLQGEQV